MKIGVIGATGAVGREMLKDLWDLFRRPDLDVQVFASPRSEGQKILFGSTELTVQAYSLKNMIGLDVVLMSAGSDFSLIESQKIVEKGVWVIDNSSAWRMNESTALVVPEVNEHILSDLRKPSVIANPNCSTIQMVVALNILKKKFGLKKVHVSTYQSVSGAGQKGIDELKSKSSLQNDPSPKLSLEDQNSSKAFNVIPAIDRFVDGGHCFEEVKMIQETRKILEDPSLDILATTVRVPVYFCHSESIYVELEKMVTKQDIVNAFQEDDGVEYIEHDDYQDLVTPRRYQGQRGVYLSRARLPYGHKESDWVQFWNLADNLKKGAATNAVQILLALSSRYP